MNKITTLLLGLSIVAGTATKAQWQLTGNNNATGTSLLGTTNSVSLRLATKNTPRLVIDTLGRVGIGITLPTTALMVRGSGTNPAASWTNIGKPVFSGFGETNVGNADFILGLAGATTTLNPAPRFAGRRSRGTLAAPTAVANGDLLMSFSAFGYDGTAFQNPAEIGFFVDGTQSGTAVPTNILFSTGNNGASRLERMRIASTGDISMNTNQFFLQRSNGNVGLGTLTPGAKLEVAGQVKITGGSPGAGKVLMSDGTGLASWANISSAGGWLLNGNTGISELTHFLGTTDSNAVIVRTNNQEALRVFPNLPIVAGAPADPVDVLRIQRAGTFNNKWYVNASFQLGSYEPGIYARTQMDIALNDDGNPIYPPNKVMSLRSNGFVGIGNTSPTTTLDVNGVGKFGNYLKIGTDVAEGYFQNAQDGAYRALATGGDQGYFFQNTNGVNTTMYVGLNGTYAGRVGIGTTTPDTTLDVNGVGKFGDYLKIGTDVTEGFFQSVNDGGYRALATGGEQGYFFQNANGAYTSMFVGLNGYYAGRVGIGTTTPTAQLEVGGEAKINGITVGRGAGNVYGNTAVGLDALASNTTGTRNTGIGYDALALNQGGVDNTSIGGGAMYTNRTGNSNTGVGVLADVSTISQSNCTALGFGATVDASNKVRVGNASVTSIGGKVAWTSFSDGRIKQNVKENVPGLDFIKLLKPVTYTYNLAKEYELMGRTDSSKYEGKNDIEKINFTGFIAQDVEAAAKKINYDFSGVDKSGNIMGLRYSDFVVPLVKAVQELSTKNEELKVKAAKVDDLQTQLQNQQKQIDELKAALLQLAAQKTPCTTRK